jgi:hypothetical protein
MQEAKSLKRIPNEVRDVSNQIDSSVCRSVKPDKA